MGRGWGRQEFQAGKREEVKLTRPSEARSGALPLHPASGCAGMRGAVWGCLGQRGRDSLLPRAWGPWRDAGSAHGHMDLPPPTGTALRHLQGLLLLGRWQVLREAGGRAAVCGRCGDRAGRQPSPREALGRGESCGQHRGFAAQAQPALPPWSALSLMSNWMVDPFGRGEKHRWAAVHLQAV